MFKDKLQLFVKAGFCKTIELQTWEKASKTSFESFNNKALSLFVPVDEGPRKLRR